MTLKSDLIKSFCLDSKADLSSNFRVLRDLWIFNEKKNGSSPSKVDPAKSKQLQYKVWSFNEWLWLDLGQKRLFSHFGQISHFSMKNPLLLLLLSLFNAVITGWKLAFATHWLSYCFTKLECEDLQRQSTNLNVKIHNVS